MVDTLLEGLGALGHVLSAPGDYARGALAGRFGDRVTGHELLRELGLDPGDDWAGTGAGIATDIATDPLTYAGGALVRGLTGVLGKARKARTVGTPEWDAANVFDLPGDVAKADNLDLVDRAFPVPTKAAEPIGLPVIDRPPDVPLPMLNELPRASNYDFGHAYMTPGMAGPTSPVDDMVREGLKGDALRASLGQWDAALDDLSRLTPGARNQLDDGLHGWDVGMRGRFDDLDAIRGLGSAVTDPSLLPLVEGQMDRIRTFFPNQAGQVLYPSKLLGAATDIGAGNVRPSDVRSWLQPGRTLAHLPLDEAQLRRIAAQGQTAAMLRQIGNRVDDVEGYLNAPFGQGFAGVTQADVNLAGDAPDIGRAVYETDLVRRLIGRIVSPGEAGVYSEIEPNIAHRVLAALENTDPGLADRLAGLNAVAATYQPNLARAMAREAELMAAEAARRARVRGVQPQPEF